MTNLKEYLLDNVDELKDVVRELSSWDGGLDHLNVYENDEDFFNTFFEGRPMEAVRAAHHGDYNFMDDYVRFNGYGNLESLSEYDYENELKSYVDEIIDELESKSHHLNLSADLQELLDEEEEE